MQLHGISDFLIWLSYMGIPVLLIYFVKKRPDLPYKSLFVMFGLFITFCGFTHLMEIITLWHPMYRFAGIVKLLTALISVATAVTLIPMLPSALALRGPNEMRDMVDKQTERLNKELENHRMTEAQLWRSQVFLRTVIENIPHGILVSEAPQLNCVTLNKAVETLFQSERDSMYGKPIQEVLPEPLREPICRLARAAFAGGEAAQENIQFKDGAGRARTLHVKQVPTQGLEDGQSYLITIIDDITDHMEADKKFRLAVEASTNAMLMVDARGGIALANHAAQTLFEYTPEEFKGVNIDMLVPDRFRPRHADYRSEFLSAPEVRPMGEGRDLFALTRSGEEFPVEIGLNPIQVEDEIFVMCSVIDITERKRAEESLRKYADQLAASNRELEQFAYIASHDLQEPLRMVSSYTQLLDEKYRDVLDDEGREFIHYAVDGATRMRTLINDLLNYSRVGRVEGRRENVSLNDVMEDVVFNLQETVRLKDAEVHIGPLPTVVGDRSRLVQLMQNLVSNAIKFCGEAPKVRVSCEDGGGWWLVRVEDNGIGIEDEYLERVFQPFYRLHARDKYEGSGIGLAVCAKIVEAMRGRIHAQRREGGGTVFVVEFPKSEERGN